MRREFIKLVFYDIRLICSKKKHFNMTSRCAKWIKMYRSSYLKSGNYDVRGIDHGDICGYSRTCWHLLPMFSLDWGYWITFALLLQDPHEKIPKGFVIRRFFFYLPSAVFIALMLVGPIKRLKQVIQIKRNRVKNPNWPEANQLAIYKHGQGFELRTTMNKSS